MKNDKNETKSEQIDRLYREEIAVEDARDKRAFYDKGWFWIVVVIVIGIGGFSHLNFGSDPVQKQESSSTPNIAPKTEDKPVVKTDPPKNLEWKTVSTFKGGSIGNTQPFTVGDKWRIVWKATPGSMGDGNFVIHVNKPGSPAAVDMVGNIIGEGGDTSNQSGAGTYYLGILSDENYEITVQTLTDSLPSQPTINNWAPVFKVSGESMKNTETFTIKAPWRIKWNSEPGKMGDGNFSVTIQGDKQNVPLGTVANVIGKNEGFDYEYTSGTYSLKILTDEKYTIEIEQGQ